VNAMQPGDVLLLENLRFHAGEEANDPAFADALAANGDLYVNDAFSAAHRAHASTEALAHRLPSYAGEQLRLELEPLHRALGHPERPVLGVVGGSKVSTKLELLSHLVTKLDKLAIGGGMANTFLYAQGHDVGASYCEKDLADTAREIIRLAGQNNCKLFLPLDVVVAEKMAPGAPARVRHPGSIDDDEGILEAGPETVEMAAAASAGRFTSPGEVPTAAMAATAAISSSRPIAISGHLAILSVTAIGRLNAENTVRAACAPAAAENRRSSWFPQVRWSAT